MSARRVLAVLAASLAALVPLSAAPAAIPILPDAVGHIVILDDRASAAAVAAEHATALGLDVTHVYSSALQGYAAAMTPAVATAVRSLPGVAWVERDRTMTATAQTLPTGIDRIDADLSPTAKIDGVDGRVGVDVAVLDTGISLSHPDLNVHTAGAKNCILSLLSANDLHGHGSHVAGTIGAKDNGSGVVGVAPGARLWPVKVLTDLGTGSTSSVVCGVDYVASRSGEIEVANMSLGGSGSDDGNCGNSNGDSLHKAICAAVAKGVTFVVAAGNDSADSSKFTPAAYDEVITVSALADFNGKTGGGAAPTCRTDVDDTFADFSNYGADVDLIAPGVCIYSTWSGSGYATVSGTSMASPHVAGAAALYKAVNPGASPAAVKSALASAGTFDWTEDRDSIKEPLVNASKL